jgi:hypothetical protein
MNANPPDEFLNRAAECQQMAKDTRDPAGNDVEPHGREMAAMC